MKKTTAILATLALATGAFAQGSLTPPGAPSATMKTLEQIEPRTDLATVAGDADYHHVISQPGSYYLSGNLVVTKTSGIYINIAGVTLDLNGFEISRASGSGGYGIDISFSGDRATVRNGSIGGFNYGIKTGTSTYGCLLEKLSVSGCTTYGIEVGVSSRIIDCRAHDNPGSGLYANVGSSLEGCTASSNQGTYGINARYGSSLNDCTAFNNTVGYGIYAYQGSSLNGCTAFENTGGYGIYAGSGSTLQGCTARNNQGNYGISAISSTLRGCTAYDNTGTGSTSYGIYAFGSTIVECTAKYNTNTNSPGTSSQGVGIYAGTAGIVKDCNASGNQGDGIQLSIDCLVTGTLCSKNGNGGDGAGIHATSSDNRIENNNVTGNDRGIDVDSVGSFIARNTASGNTSNYEIAANNKVGVIVSAPNSAAISGSTGGAGVGSTNPWANFSF